MRAGKLCGCVIQTTLLTSFMKIMLENFRSSFVANSQKFSTVNDLHCIVYSGGSRNSERGFPLVVDARHRGLGAQPPDAE